MTKITSVIFNERQGNLKRALINQFSGLSLRIHAGTGVMAVVDPYQFPHKNGKVQ